MSAPDTSTEAVERLAHGMALSAAAIREAGYIGTADARDEIAATLRALAAKLDAAEAALARVDTWTQSAADTWSVSAAAGAVMLCEARKERDAALSRAEAAEAEVERLRAGIQAYQSGDYEHPRRHRPGGCGHGRPYYEECAQCDGEHFTALLAAAQEARDAG